MHLPIECNPADILVGNDVERSSMKEESLLSQMMI